MRATSGGQVCGACLHKSRCDLCRMFILWKVAVFCGCVQVLLLFLRGVQRRVLNLSHQDLSHSWPCDETLEGGAAASALSLDPPGEVSEGQILVGEAVLSRPVKIAFHKEGSHLLGCQEGRGTPAHSGAHSKLEGYLTFYEVIKR